MEDRIQINGKWYVREEQPIKIDIIQFQGMLTESDEYCFKATRTERDDTGEYYEGVDIEFTDKRVQPWRTEYWDNDIWLNGVLEDDTDVLHCLREEIRMSPIGISELKAFIKVLKEKKWL